MALNLFKRKNIKKHIDVEVRYKLTTQHLMGLETLLDRFQMLEKMPSSGIVAEIGVDHGVFSKRILEICNPKKLFLVDSWESDRFSPGEVAVRRKLKDDIDQDRVEIIKMDSISAAKQIANKTLDWVYLDTDHSYETSVKELYAYAEKIKANGIIAGHDYCLGNWSSQYRYGVIDAVHEFCVKEGYKIIYLTSSNEYYRSYAIQKI